MINSKPEIEQVYLENLNFLKEVIKGYYNHRTAKKIDSFDELKNSNLLTKNSERLVIEKILRKNGVAMKKGGFSEKFFTNAFRQKSKISIIQRIESIVC